MNYGTCPIKNLFKPPHQLLNNYRIYCFFFTTKRIKKDKFKRVIRPISPVLSYICGIQRPIPVFTWLTQWNVIAGPRFCDLTDRLEKMSSYFRDTDESSHSTSTTDDKVTARPPRASSDFRRSVGLPSSSGRFMDIPSSSKSSSRSNVSPFGRTPPSSSPNVS